MQTTIRTLLVSAAAAAVALCCGCDLGKDAAETTEKGSEGAVSVAEKMSEGTVGGAEESGDE